MTERILKAKLHVGKDAQSHAHPFAVTGIRVEARMAEWAGGASWWAYSREYDFEDRP